MLLGLFCCVAQVETQPTPTPESGKGIEGSIILHNIQAGPTREGVPDSKPLGKMTFVVQKGNESVASFETDVGS